MQWLIKEKKEAFGGIIKEIGKNFDIVKQDILELEGNLTYYIADYAEFATSEDRHFARKTARKIYDIERLKPFEEQDYSIIETYCWVLRKLPFSVDDIEESQKLLPEILNNVEKLAKLETDIVKKAALYRDLEWFKEKYGVR